MKIEKAIAIAVEAHTGQKDKAGRPYILHCLRVMARMDTEQEMVLAVLHDVLEEGSDEIIERFWDDLSLTEQTALSVLTRPLNKSYHHYIQHIIEGGPLPQKIKLADLEDNLNLLRLNREPDLQMVRRYHAAWLCLKEVGHGQ